MKKSQEEILEFKNAIFRASLAAQWLGVHLPMQQMQVQALVQEDPTCHGAAEPGACEPQLLTLRATTAGVHTPGAHAPQQERPPQ